MKLLSLNVSLFDKNNEKLDAFLREEEADILCLQEVSRKIEASAQDAFISQDAIDMATPNLPFTSFAPNWRLKNFTIENFHGEKYFHYDFGGVIEYGNYIRSKYKIIGENNFFLQGSLIYIYDWNAFAKKPGEEPRVIQIVDLQMESSKLRVLNYHGIWSKDKQGTNRTLSANKEIVRLASEVDYPVIICGDFNLFPDTQSMKIVKEKFTSLVDKFHVTHTRPLSNELSSTKRNVVDYIFVNKKVTVERFNVIDSDVSDHLPLVLEFDLTT